MGQSLVGCYAYKNEKICYNLVRGYPEPEKRKERTKKALKKQKDMKDKYFTLHSFMQEELGLSGVTLMVYALIYSFTRAGSDCHGSLSYIAERVGASTRSVQRALKELTDKGYITKLTNYKTKSNHYLADMDRVRYFGYRQEDYDNETECLPTTDRMSNNKKEDNEEYTKILNYIHSDAIKINRPIESFGKNKLVKMTLHQYANLLRAFGVLPARGYIRELDDEIFNQLFPEGKDHYKEIISRATEDGRMTNEGFEILMS